MDKQNTYLLVLCFTLVIVKLIAISTTNFNLYGDEAQYWLWSKDFSFGYFSKPPLLAWIVGLVSSIFGNSFFVLKTIPILLYCVSSILIFFFTKKLFNDFSLAYCCALTFFLLPAVSLSSFLLTTDIILIMLWVGALIQVLRIKENPNYLNFLLFGFLIGLAFLAKYAAIYFLISLILLFIADKNYRFFFLQNKYKFFLSLLTSLVILFPNILWNYKNNWLTLDHTFDNASLSNIKINFIGFFEFFISQIFMIGPVLFVGFLLCLYKKFNISSKEKFLICFALPALIIVLIESLLVRAHANWAAVSLISLSILFVSVIHKLNRIFIYLNNYLNLFVGFVLFVMIAISFPLSVFDRISGMKNFVSFLDKKNYNNINIIVVSDRLLFANLSYEYYSKQKTFYSPLQSKHKVSHHFQLKNPLPSDFSENFILIGHINDIDYIPYTKKIKLLGSKPFPFSDKNLKIYEIIFY